MASASSSSSKCSTPHKRRKAVPEYWLFAVLWDLERPDLVLFPTQEQAEAAALEYLRDNYDAEELTTEIDGSVIPWLVQRVRLVT